MKKYFQSPPGLGKEEFNDWNSIDQFLQVSTVTTEEDICRDNISDNSENEDDCNEDAIPSDPTSKEM